MLSIVTLAATLIFQAWQYQQSDLVRKDAADEAAWKNAIDILSKSSKLSPEVLAVKPFLASPKHSQEAKAIVVQLLSNSTDTALFDDLFYGVFSPVDWSNIDFVLKLDRALAPKAFEVFRKSFIPETGLNNTDILSNFDKQTYEYVRFVLPKLCSEIGSLLKSTKPPEKILDLSGTLFLDCDWKGINLKDVKIDNLDLRSVDLDNASLETENFQWVYFYATAWWKVSRLSPRLSKFLRENYPCDSNTKYGTHKEQFSIEQCQKINVL